MPGTVVIAGQLTIKEPCIGGRLALVCLQPAPGFGHAVDDGRNDILTGRTHHIRYSPLLPIFGNNRSFYGNQPSVYHRDALHSAGCGLGRFPGCKQVGRGQGPQRSEVRTTGTGGYILPEVVMFRGGGGGAKAFSHAAQIVLLCTELKAKPKVMEIRMAKRIPIQRAFSPFSM